MATTLSQRQRLKPLHWVCAWLLAAALALAIFGLAVPSSPLFFPLASLLANVALFMAALWVLRVAGVHFERFHWAVMAALWAGSVLYFYWALSRREFVYIWDYVNYINKQYSAEAAFEQSCAAGFEYIFGSLADDYTNFITFFIEFPFCLTGRTGDDFAFCQVFSIVPALLLLLAGLVRKVGELGGFKNERWYFVFGLGWLFSYPFLRMSAMLAQPDWFGLIFAFCIVVLTLGYRFEKLEPARCLLLFLATAAVILTRRWYLYFVVAYYFAYAVLVLAGSCKLARAGQKAAARACARNLVVFGLAAMAAMLILLWPMVKHILSYDYSGHYSYYKSALGVFAELFTLHPMRLGVFGIPLVALGLWYAFKRGQRALAWLGGCEVLAASLMFSSVQNSGSHQNLIYLPGWYLLFLLGTAAFTENIARRRPLKLGVWCAAVAFSVTARCAPLTMIALPDAVEYLLAGMGIETEYVRLDTLIYNRPDIGQIRAIAQWIDANCAEGELAYMIPHDMLYCPDHFKNCDLPSHPIDDKLAFGFSVPGTHNFPMAFFEAKYVLTADPFPQTYVGDGEMSNKLNDMFLAVRDEYFVQVETFDMGNGTVFTVWERTVPATRAEVEYYLSAFTAEDEQYPEMFSQVAEAWLAARGM